MEVYNSSVNLIFMFHYITIFESDFKIDDAKLVCFSDIFAIKTVSLILFMHHSFEFDFQ